MSVYVDRLVDYGWRIRGRRVRSCHMIADSLEELHTMALQIGLRHRWFQDKGWVPHYDLTASRRSKAVAAGARELDRRMYVHKMREIRGAAPAP